MSKINKLKEKKELFKVISDKFDELISITEMSDIDYKQLLELWDKVITMEEVYWIKK